MRWHTCNTTTSGKEARRWQSVKKLTKPNQRGSLGPSTSSRMVLVQSTHPCCVTNQASDCFHPQAVSAVDVLPRHLMHMPSLQLCAAVASCVKVVAWPLPWVCRSRLYRCAARCSASPRGSVAQVASAACERAELLVLSMPAWTGENVATADALAGVLAPWCSRGHCRSMTPPMDG